MKKSFFLLLLTTFIFAQTPKPKIFFRSGFENNSQMFIINHDRMAIDQSDITYLPPNNWSNLGDEVPEAYNRGHYIYYQEGNDSQRIAEIINDPININALIPFMEC